VYIIKTPNYLEVIMELKLRIGNQVFKDVKDYMTLDYIYKNAEKWISEDKEKWNHITFLAYYLVKYRTNYGVFYRFNRWKDHPAKTKECKDILRLIKEFKGGLNMIGETSDKSVNVKLYNYMNWIFDKKFRKPKMVTGTGIFLKSNLINEFEILYMRKVNERRNSNSISILKQWLEQNAPSILEDYSINDKNDINIFKNFYINSNLPVDCPETIFYNQLKEMRLV